MQLQQNPEAYQDSLEPPFDNHFAMLHLDQPCTTCASCHASTSNPMKRRSPTSLHQDPTLFSDSDSDSQPKPKKLFLDQDNQTHQGFSKLSLPFQPHSYPLLRRSISDPPQSPENAKTAIIPVTPSSHTGLPPLPPTLRRSVSDPNPSPVKTYSRSSSSGDVSSVDITNEDTPNSNSNSKVYSSFFYVSCCFNSCGFGSVSICMQPFVFFNNICDKERIPVSIYMSIKVNGIDLLKFSL